MVINTEGKNKYANFGIRRHDEHWHSIGHTLRHTCHVARVSSDSGITEVTVGPVVTVVAVVTEAPVVTVVTVVCVTKVPCYLSGMLLLWVLLWVLLSEPELYNPRLLFRKNGKHPELGSGSGGKSSRKSGLGVLFGPKMLSSWKLIKYFTEKCHIFYKEKSIQEKCIQLAKLV